MAEEDNGGSKKMVNTGKLDSTSNKKNIIQKSQSSNINPDLPRLCASKLLYLVCEEKNFLNLSLENTFDRFNLSSLDRSFATAIAYGTLSDIVLIDEIIKLKADINFDKIDPVTKSILRTGLWQIFMSGKIPDSAACNESVKIAGASGNRGSKVFVNALLRSAIRDKQEITEKIIKNPKKFYLKCGLPPELAGYFKKWFKEERAISICQSMRKTPLTSVRVNTLVADSSYVENELKLNGCDVFQSHFMENAFSIKTNGFPVEKIFAFNEGSFTIQDESAMLVSRILNPDKGSIVVDVCSAPGGKTCHIAEIMQNKGVIFALDISRSRLKLVEETAKRLKIDIIKTIESDATMEMNIGEDFSKADFVLADVPCSGLGIMRRKPEIKLNMTHERICGLYNIQESILNNSSHLLKPGGILVYSTCTLNPDENENRIKKFLWQNHKEFEPVDFSDILPENLIKTEPAIAQSAKNGMITILPDLHSSDGFFIAKLRRKNN